MILAALLTLGIQASAMEHRWVYVMTNLQVAKNADMVCDLITRAKKSGYNGFVLADSKFQRLGDVPDFYFINARKVIDVAKANQIELIPAVWPVGYASAMLGHDVNLIEGLPVRNARFVARGGDARPETGDSNLLPTGNFEAVAGDKVAGTSFQDGIGQSTVVDRSEKHEGSQSLRFENFKVGNDAGNARIVWTLEVKPFHQYFVSGWTRRENVKGLIQIIALDSKNRNLIINEIAQDSTAPWASFKFSFNSLESSSIRVYAGVWGGTTGRLWWDDIAVRDAGLLNVIRRPGAPLTVKGSDGAALTEGKDFAPIRDPGLGLTPWPGEYDVEHSEPSIKILPGGRIKEGDVLSVSFYHAKTGIGNQTSICLSEPKTAEILADEAKRVNDLFRSKGLFWSHDEVRIGGWCQACQSRKLTPGQIFAEHVRTCTSIQQRLAPKSEVYVWSDMFDPYHNAVDGYYLTNGTLAGAWEGLPKNAIIVNWNFGQRAKSLPYFASRGHRQILAGYYDGPIGDIKTWIDEARKTKSLSGVMYTTWVGNYSGLEEFARVAWGGK